MTDKEKLIKIKSLADKMSDTAFNMTTDASLLRKAMDEYHQFIINEYHKEEQIIKELQDEPVSNSLDYAKMTIQRLEKRRMLPTLKCKNLHDFKNEFNAIKQILHLHVYPGSQEKIAYYFALHWATWGATHLKDLFAVADSDSKKMDNKQPISKKLEEAAFDYAEACKYDGGEKLLCVEHFKAGAEWQKEQMMANATKVTVHIDAGNYPYIPQIELYDYDKEIPLAKEGDKYKVVLIK